MNRTHRTLKLISVLIIGLMAGTTYNKFFAVASGQAQQASREAIKSPRWEYCAITGMSFTLTGGKALATIWIRHLRPSGADFVGISVAVNPNEPPKDETHLRRWTAALLEREGISLAGSATVDTSKEALHTQAKREALAQAVAKLGEEGWELIGPEPRNLEGFSVNINTSSSQTSGTVNTPFVLYFKRQKS
ncbi:MAG TPA: hypothetical protein VD966_06065 [Pyrinomonadaceae bacterium]|nr:hypothetical protein [Pyrinomonadaceae bacterium]